MKLHLFFLIFLLIILGVRLYSHAVSSVPPLGQLYTISGTILDEPRSFRGSQSITLNTIRVVLPPKPRLHYGDQITVQGIVTEETMERNGRSRTFYQMDEAIILSHKSRFVFEVINVIHLRIKEVFQQSIDARQADLILGIVFGMTDAMDQKLYDQLVATGVLHVVSASGANISILASIVQALLRPVFKRQIATIITMMVIAGYTILASLDPSIVRAAIMAWLMLAATLIGRQHYALWAVIISAFGMLIIDPFLLHDVGFQLSFAATVGIITLKPLFDQIISPRYQSIASDITTTIAAQIMTLPIMFASFGSFSLISVFVNAIVLWMVAPLMIIGVVAGIAAFVLPITAQIILMVIYPLLTLFLSVISFFSQYSYLVEISYFPFSWLLSYYFFTAGLIVVMHKNHK